MPRSVCATSAPLVVLLSVAVLLLVAAPPAAHAQDGERTIDFNEAVRIALDQNTDLKRAANEVELQDMTIWNERMDFAPDLRFSTSLSRSFGRSFSQEEGGIVNQTTDFLSGTASASITVFNGFENVASLKQANAQGQANELSLERTRQDVVFQVMDRYLAFVRNKELITVREEQLEAQRQQLRQIEEQVEVGSRPMSEQFQQEANVAEAEQQLLDAEQQAEVSKTRLIQTLHLDPFGEYQFAAPAVDSTDLMDEQYQLDRLLKQAFDRRVDLRAREAEVQVAEQGIRIARSRYYPTVSLGVDYGTSWSSRSSDQLPVPGTSTPPDTAFLQPVGGSPLIPVPVPGTGSPGEFRTLDFVDHLDNRRGGSVGIQLSFPIFDGLQREAQVERAQVQARNAQYALEDQRQNIALQVRQAYLDYQNASKQLEVARTRLRAADRAREAAQERYNLGAAPYVELAQAQADYADAASQRVRARYNFVFQQKLIDYYMGVLNPQEPLFR